MSNTAYALTGFVSWALFLLVLMEVIRTYLVVTGKVAANGFTPDNGGLSPFMQRLARTHANCIEGLPVFGGLLAIAIMTSRTDVTDRLALPVSWRPDRAIDYPPRFDQPDSGKSPVQRFRCTVGDRPLLGVETAGLRIGARNWSSDKTVPPRQQCSGAKVRSWHLVDVVRGRCLLSTIAPRGGALAPSCPLAKRRRFGCATAEPPELPGSSLRRTRSPVPSAASQASLPSSPARHRQPRR